MTLREDIIERVRQIYAEIEKLQKEMDEIKKRLRIEDGDEVKRPSQINEQLMEKLNLRGGV